MSMITENEDGRGGGPGSASLAKYLFGSVKPQMGDTDLGTLNWLYQTFVQDNMFRWWQWQTTPAIVSHH